MTLELAFLKCQQLSGGVNLILSCVFAMDETGLKPSLKESYFLAKIGSKAVYATTSD